MKADGSVQERLKEVAKLWRVAAPPHAREAAPRTMCRSHKWDYGTGFDVFAALIRVAHTSAKKNSAV